MYRIYPFIPVDYNIPPTLYSIMNSLANYEEDKTKIRDLASATHDKIFDFYYPLSENIDRKDFECMILNKFIRRRIGFETMTAFKIALEVKLNEILPMYNKLFDMLEGWDLFSDGERISTMTKEVGESSVNNNASTTTDNRYSDTPQGHLEEVQDGTYISQYTYNQGNSNSTTSGNDERNKTEIKTRTPADKIKIYKEFIENRNSIMSMIFNDLECLFYMLG